MSDDIQSKLSTVNFKDCRPDAQKKAIKLTKREQAMKKQSEQKKVGSSAMTNRTIVSSIGLFNRHLGLNSRLIERNNRGQRHDWRHREDCHPTFRPNQQPQKRIGEFEGLQATAKGLVRGEHLGVPEGQANQTPGGPAQRPGLSELDQVALSSVEIARGRAVGHLKELL